MKQQLITLVLGEVDKPLGGQILKPAAVKSARTTLPPERKQP